MLRASSAIFVVTTVHLVRLSEALFGFGDSCSVTFPSEQWKPRVAYEAAFNGKPQISIPLVGSGFNRTVNIDGFCNDVLMNSSAFSCKSDMEARGEFNAYVTDMEKAPTSAKITFDNVNCPLRGVSIRRTKPGALFEAEIRFEFEFCKAISGTATAPVESAAVVYGLRKELGQTSNLLPWMQEVCKVGTTTPASASIVLKYEYPLVTVGKGKCKHDDASSAKEIAGVTTEDGCKAECRSSLEVAAATGEEDGSCTGFAFSAAAAADKQCIMYTSKVTELDTPDDAWMCYNMSLTHKEYEKTTAPPNPMQALSELTQNLQLREVMAGAHATMTTAKLVQVEPRKEDFNCFPKAWWFAVQDDAGNPASIPVDETNWVAMMDMIPEPKAEHEGVRSTMIIDRVLLQTCNPNAAGWGRTCEQPKVVGVCDHKQTANALVTGLLVPIIGWLVVRFCHRSCGLGRPDPNGPENFPLCTFANIFVLSVIAVLTCASVAAGCSIGISYAFGAAGCKHGLREMIVVAVATAVPASLAMVIGLLYMHNSREAPKLEAAATQHVTSGHKLMLVEVPDGSDISQARPLNPDVLTTGSSAMSAYRSQGGPSRIDVHANQDAQSQFLSGFQHPPAASMLP